MRENRSAIDSSQNDSDTNSKLSEDDTDTGDLETTEGNIVDSDENPLIVIVDDDPGVLNSLKRSLRKEPYSVMLVSDLNSAVELLRTNQASVVISDFQMPGGSGATLLGIIKREQPNCIRILLSGADYAGSVPKELASSFLNCHKYLVKPWDADELKAIIRESIAEYEAALKK